MVLWYLRNFEDPCNPCPILSFNLSGFHDDGGYDHRSYEGDGGDEDGGDGALSSNV